MSVMPSLTPVKVQMEKCEYCFREFCSSFNLRRHAQVHTRAHHRSFNVKEHEKNREQLSAYWDKLSPEKAKDVISFNDAMLPNGLSGSTVMKALASTLCKPGGVWILPHAYVNAGSTLLDIVNSKNFELKISSKELFNALIDASERTLLFAGTSGFAQTYVFNGDDATGCHKLKNVISIAGLLFERQLMKAWFDDKDAEALRCQNQLVEEEEAAQKRLALLSEKKRQKKLRKKEQKLKERLNESPNVEADSVDTPALAQESAPPPSSDSKPDSPNLSLKVDNTKHKDREHSQINELKAVRANGHQRPATVPRYAMRSQSYRRIGFRANYHRNAPPKQVWVVKKLTVVNSGEERSKSSSPLVAEEGKYEIMIGSISIPLRLAEEEDKYEEVMIGSISIPLRRSVSKQKDEGTTLASKPRDSCNTVHPRPSLMKENPDEPLKTANSRQSGASLVGSKQWRPVSRSETKSSLLLPVGREKEGLGSGQSHDANLHGYTSAAAREFLARRWKEALSSEHVVL